MIEEKDDRNVFKAKFWISITCQPPSRTHEEAWLKRRTFVIGGSSHASGNKKNKQLTG